MVAMDPGDVAVPAGERQGVQQLSSGSAVADHAWRALLGATVALAGRDVRISSLARLSDDPAVPGPILLPLVDVVAGLRVTAAAHMPDLRTVAVVCGHPTHDLDGHGWQPLTAPGADVPCGTGLAREAAREAAKV